VPARGPIQLVQPERQAVRKTMAALDLLRATGMANACAFVDEQ
jgi:hypothetical protein